MEFIIISGLSGAGKSRAASIMEDMGFFCVDNLPAPLIPKFAELGMGGNGEYDRVALVTDVRGGTNFDGLFQALDGLKAMKCGYRIVFMEASDPVIIRRYKETRRNHPLAEECGSLEEAIALERNGMDLTIFANSVNNRAHQQDDYRYVTNTIYAKMLSDQPLDLDAVSVSFTDVPDSHWAADGIAYAVDNGLMTGTSSTAFSPAASTTRGMLMTVLARQAGVDTSTGSTWYEAGMNWAVDEGISDGSNPNGSITRQELAVMLYRSAGAQPGTADLSGYADGDSVASWAADAVRWAVDEGILSGKSGNRLDPAGTASRAEVAVMLQRAFT